MKIWMFYCQNFLEGIRNQSAARGLDMRAPREGGSNYCMAMKRGKTNKTGFEIRLKIVKSRHFDFDENC